jgi:hypothetical protein
MDNFFPKKTVAYSAYDKPDAQYEGVKAAFDTEIDVIEGCNDRCVTQTSLAGETCLKKCF